MFSQMITIMFKEAETKRSDLSRVAVSHIVIAKLASFLTVDKNSQNFLALIHIAGQKLGVLSIDDFYATILQLEDKVDELVSLHMLMRRQRLQ